MPMSWPSQITAPDVLTRSQPGNLRGLLRSRTHGDGVLDSHIDAAIWANIGRVKHSPSVVRLDRRIAPGALLVQEVQSTPLLSYIGAIQFMRHGREILQEGYAKHKGSAFRITMLDTWVVILCGAKLNEELRKLPDDQMSFIHAIEE
ncbi:predicted protein, partial [Postia placenta Mad-698-R]